MIDVPNVDPPFEGLDIRIPIITPIKGTGFINQGSGLPSVTAWIMFVLIAVARNCHLDITHYYQESARRTAPDIIL